MDDYEADNHDSNLDDFNTYEEYLDAQIAMSQQALFYLEDQELARQLYEVGFMGKTEIITRQQFKLRKQQAAEARKNQ